MLELKDVFLKHSKTYKQKYNLSQHTLKTIYRLFLFVNNLKIYLQNTIL